MNDRAPALALEVEGLTFSYPDAPAPVLDDCSWEVPAGAFALLVGGTGSGKSTLLSLCKPQIAPAGERAGAIRVLGQPVDELSDAESARAIGYVFQNPENQIVCDTVWHEMAFGLENLGTPQDEMRRRVAETSYFFGIEDWFHAETDALSGGKKQLLALASTLAMRPRLLLLDEPTAQLDPIAEKNFLHALFRVNRELGCTVVVATHRPQPMLEYATCAFELRGGRATELADMAALDVRLSLLAGGACSEAGCEKATDDASPFVEAMPGANADEAACTCFGDALQPVAGDAGACARSNAPGYGVRGVVGDSSTGFKRQVSSAAARVGFRHGPNERNAEPAASLSNKDGAAASLAGAWFKYPAGESWVLRGLDVRVGSGCIHAIVGGNGCGKSTLLAVLAQAKKLKRGRLRKSVRSTALLPQDPKALFVAESVRAELEEASTLAGASAARVQSLLDEFGLSGRAELHPYDLSGGQQQLLALAKILVLDPELLLLDEPTKGLDLASRRMMAARLRALAAAGKTVVMATHDLDFAEQVADAVSMMFDGEIACTQPARQFFADNIYYRP